MTTTRGSLWRQVVGGVGRLADLGVQSTDSSQERAAKTALTLAALLLGSFAGVWTLVYLLNGLTAAWVITLVYQVSLLLALGHFALTKRFAVFRLASLSLHLVTPIAVQVALGGFHPSSGVALWSLVAPLGALLAYGSRESLRWFAAYVVLVGGSVAVDAWGITSGVHVPTATVAIFFVANICGVSAVVFMLVRYFVRERERAIRVLAEQHALLAEEQRRSEGLLLNILPAPVAERLKQRDGIIADRLPDVSVLFADIVGFTELSERWPPERIVEMLNGLFTAFDELADSWGLEKIKTIGDAYMVAGGLHVRQPEHTAAVAHMAFAMQQEAHRQRASAGFALELRIGIAVGPVVAGVIGRHKFAYDMWGDTVNMASRMESTGTVGSIQVSGAVYERLRADFCFEQRERVLVKGKGEITTYILLGERSVTTARAVTQPWK
ncbi:adenylate/guanylate cyclase domain-containing protein [Cryobacterium sp. Sr8]|uniref:adenylate/guanylate cyclase domain-containing protein n=1 Tax=Cryobacterium sp. Sr8 TaxID=1259203 RepID=UPI00106B959E|nr:adenylate/guanylate cyclase domain-containing protein [Cryobacterium sp. Sr8]TFD80923.1 adenylate/guanylate cyclase domain-containing protein [Cryobacterium sp. Sr8]